MRGEARLVASVALGGLAAAAVIAAAHAQTSSEAPAITIAAVER